MSSEELSHILFVDDVVMMDKVTWENLIEAKLILDLYKTAIGMPINVEKSILSENGISDPVRNMINS